MTLDHARRREAYIRRWVTQVAEQPAYAVHHRDCVALLMLLDDARSVDLESPRTAWRRVEARLAVGEGES